MAKLNLDDHQRSGAAAQLNFGLWVFQTGSGQRHRWQLLDTLREENTRVTEVFIALSENGREVSKQQYPFMNAKRLPLSDP